jgi:hypothetical protein
MELEQDKCQVGQYLFRVNIPELQLLCSKYIYLCKQNCPIENCSFYV